MGAPCASIPGEGVTNPFAVRVPLTRIAQARSDLSPRGEVTLVASERKWFNHIGICTILGRKPLRELVRTNDAVLVSAIQALLEAAQIPHIVLDQNMSVLEGSIGILPRRVLVAEDYAGAARRLLEQAGLGHELRGDAR
jgi:hypothetical protein